MEEGKGEHHHYVTEEELQAVQNLMMEENSDVKLGTVYLIIMFYFSSFDFLFWSSVFINIFQVYLYIHWTTLMEYLRAPDTKQILDLKEAFDIFDVDGSETIDRSELTDVINIFRKVTEEEVSI